MGELLYFCIYVVQQLGIMFGVGAQTVLLCMHLAAVRHGEKENPHASYAHAAHFALGLGIAFIVVSGVLAVGVHALNGQLATILAPAFLFKWLLIVLLTPAYFIFNRLSLSSGWYYAFTGGTWYALFLVHTLGPVTTWPTLFVLYGLWLAFFGSVWAAFVGVMRWKTTPKALPAPVAYMPPPKVAPIVSAPPIIKPAPLPPKPVPLPPKPTPPPPPPPKPVVPPPPPVPVVLPPAPPKPTPPPPPPPPPKPAAPLPAFRTQMQKPLPPVPVVQPPLPPVVVAASAELSWWKRLLAWIAGTKHAIPQAAAPVAPPPPKPVVPPPPPVPVVLPPAPPKPTPPPPPPPPPKPAAPLPALQPLELVAPAPLKVPAPPVPAPAPVPVVAPAPAVTSFVKEVIDHMLVPALRIMPQKPEDIAKHNRPPVVKLSDE